MSDRYIWFKPQQVGGHLRPAVLRVLIPPHAHTSASGSRLRKIGPLYKAGQLIKHKVAVTAILWSKSQHSRCPNYRR